jgi:hypothetical protein
MLFQKNTARGHNVNVHVHASEGTTVTVIKRCEVNRKPIASDDKGRSPTEATRLRFDEKTRLRTL